MKQRVVKKEEITKALFENYGRIHWSQIESKATLWVLDKRTNQYVELGTIRFDTYLQLDLREFNMKLPFLKGEDINDECSPFYRLKRPDAWCGYDEYMLKPRVYELCEQWVEFERYFKERIWR